MKIIFDLRGVGAGNNGGTQTLIKSANVLQKLGNEVYLIDSGKSQYTWSPILVPHLIVKQETKIPDADIIVATGYRSVKNTVSAPRRCGIKCHWIRGWETWQGPENWIVSHILKAPTVKIVNSLCLQNKLRQYGASSFIIRPGHDFGSFYPTNKRGVKVTLGGLYTTGKHTLTKRPDWVLETYKNLRKRNMDVRLYMFGNDFMKPDLVDKYIQRPDLNTKNDLYNEIDIWMSPSKLEGLHIPPAEAMLTECPVVGTRAEMSGTQEYLIDNKTGLVSDDQLYSFINAVGKLVENQKLRHELGKNARKKIIELGSREKNMEGMINLFKDLIESENL